ncbi:unnamed protein product [Ascophyllum nodosum]
MVHPKCGSENVNAPCMKVTKKINKKKCDKHYSQPYGTVAVINDKYDRADIVPYDPYLLLRYKCHIFCVDLVTSASIIVQYIYKYITRNASFTRAKIGTAINDNDIKDDHNARYVLIAASEACWRLLGFNMMSLVLQP